MTQKLRLGILGLGEGRSTLSAALHSQKMELVSMCDLNLDLCKKRAKEFGLEKWLQHDLELTNLK